MFVYALLQDIIVFTASDTIRKSSSDRKEPISSRAIRSLIIIAQMGCDRLVSSGRAR